MNKYQDLVGDDTKYNFNEKSNKYENKNENFLKTENNIDHIASRDNEINNLVNSINELATIFKDLQSLVLEQGTILDRIDHNIDTSLSNSSQAHKELIKSDENMKSNCYRNSNITLILIIFILTVLIFYKYTR
jgi:syntaxin 16